MANNSLPQSPIQIEPYLTPDAEPAIDPRIVSVTSALLDWWIDAVQSGSFAPKNDEELIRQLYERTFHSPMPFERYRLLMGVLLNLNLEGGEA